MDIKGVTEYGLLINANRGIESSRVAECIFTIAGGDDIGARDIHTSGNKVIGLKLDILDETLNFHIGVGKGRAKLADIVPLARTLCNNITDIVVQRARSDDSCIPCCKGCSTCCSRCLVPLSVPEALRFKEEIDAAPAYRRESIWGACLRAARHILKQKPPEPLISQTDELFPIESIDLNLVSNWYTSLNLRCPFLYDHACSIYDQRPLACREYFIKGSAKACGGSGVAEVLDMPIHLPNVLGQLASELEGTDVEAVILPLALVWCQENPERAERSWPAEMMVKRFVEIVEAMAKKNMPALASRRKKVIGSSKKRRAMSRLYQSSSY